MQISQINQIPSPDAISAEQFDHALQRYPGLLQSISLAKGAKHGQRTLVELDEYRYLGAVEAFGSQGQERPGLDDVKTLVEWKLDTTDLTAALALLTNLKGIGPATASLILAVLDPTRTVLFFSDEAFYWLCCDSAKRAPIKYTVKEYRMLLANGRRVMQRLGVTASDVEKVSYVLLNHSGSQYVVAAPQKAAESSAKPLGRMRTVSPGIAKVDGKEDPGVHVEQEDLRRSKRLKARGK